MNRIRQILGLLSDRSFIQDCTRRRGQLVVLEKLRSQCPGVIVSWDLHFPESGLGRFSAGRGARIEGFTSFSFGSEDLGWGEISIGADSWIGPQNNFRAGGGRIEVGAGCLISQFCTLVAANHAVARGRFIEAQGLAPEPRGIRIGDDVWLGAGVVVTPGVSIGSGAVIGANAVVTHDVPDYEIWAGVPARRIGERK